MKIFSVFLAVISLSVLTSCSSGTDMNQSSTVSSAVSTSGGSDFTLPYDILTSIPLPKDGIVETSLETGSPESGPAKVQYIRSSISVEDGIAYYTAFLEKEGWQTYNVSRLAKSAMLSFTKGNTLITVSFSEPEADGKTFIMLGAAKKPF